MALLSTVRDSSQNSSDYRSISQGPSERFERWGQGWRRSMYRAWPPTNAESYPVWKRYHMFQNMAVETMAETILGGSDGESDGISIPGESFLKARWQEVAERKVEVYAIRCRIKRARSRIEQARQERNTAENVFMSALRPAQADSTSLTTILPLDTIQAQFQRMQTTRDECQQHELVLENLEHELAKTQDNLDRLERRLINDLRHPTMGHVGTPGPLKTQVSEQSQSDVLKGLEIEPSNISHPVYQHLLSALHSIGLVRRSRAELLARRARLEEQQRVFLLFEKFHPAALQRYVTPLQDTDLEFLGCFHAEERRISNEMKDLHTEVDRLTRLSWERNLISQYTPLEDVQSWYPEDFSIDVDLGHDHIKAASTEPVAFPILLSNPQHLLEDFPMTAETFLKRATRIPEGHPQRSTAIASAAKEFSIQNLISDAEDTPNFINRWLLQSLRTSRLEVNALYSAYVSSGDTGILEIGRWQWDVLHKWWEDEAYLRTLEHFKPAPTSWISAPPSPPSWLSEPFLYTWESDTSGLESAMTDSDQAETRSQGSGNEGLLVTTKEPEQVTDFRSANEAKARAMLQVPVF